jgi:hypothetical protein
MSSPVGVGRCPYSNTDTSTQPIICRRDNKECAFSGYSKRLGKHRLLDTSIECLANVGRCDSCVFCYRHGTHPCCIQDTDPDNSDECNYYLPPIMLNAKICYDQSCKGWEPKHDEEDIPW